MYPFFSIYFPGDREDRPYIKGSSSGNVGPTLAVDWVLISRDRSQIPVYHLPPKKSLGECSNKADLDKQPGNCLYRSQSCYRII